MSDVLGMAARLLASGHPPDRLLAGLDESARRRLAWAAVGGGTGGTAPVPDLALPNLAARDDQHRLLSSCTDPECMTCGSFACPSRSDLHLHHDGCPACSIDNDEPLAGEQGENDCGACYGTGMDDGFGPEECDRCDGTGERH